MNFSIGASMVDQSTMKLSRALDPVFALLSSRLAGDYGGEMEHLWIDLELIERYAKADGSPKHAFRYQKRVSGKGGRCFGLPDSPDVINVGHYSVRPDFRLLETHSVEWSVVYILKLILDSLAILQLKRKRIGDFDVAGLRAQFIAICSEAGFRLD